MSNLDNPVMGRPIVDEGRSLAIIGGADSLKGGRLGQEIDAHGEVVRFNEIVGSKLVPEETGSRTTVHVMNTLVAPLDDPAILEVDLETNAPWSSYCKRMHTRAILANDARSTLMIRPSAYCVMAGIRAADWTRGFLFYWFIGRLFNGPVDLYGFSGNGHYHNDLEITEKWVQFEHLFYRVNNITRH
ncbi:unnamed protein product [Prorocentrum cordatum]|uniref:Amine oxidase n=1 Tax=Prorocentrum cordatum TaxID=2364126 RepID=A0ABN9V3A1_9DINO|nr:unnamed protein product [Polarella glacialis]